MDNCASESLSCVDVFGIYTAAQKTQRSSFSRFIMKEKQLLAQLLDEEKFLAEFKGVTCWNIAVKT